MPHRSCPKWWLSSKWQQPNLLSLHLPLPNTHTHHPPPHLCRSWPTGAAPQELSTVVSDSFPASAYSLGETPLQEDPTGAIHKGSTSSPSYSPNPQQYPRDDASAKGGCSREGLPTLTYRLDAGKKGVKKSHQSQSRKTHLSLRSPQKSTNPWPGNPPIPDPHLLQVQVLKSNQS
jgi:hypothetical protein